MFDWLRGLINGEPPPLPAPLAGPGREQGPGSLRSQFDTIPTGGGPQLAQYPTSQDALTARQGGFGYGEPTSAYIEGTAGRIFGDKKGALPAEGSAKVKLEGITREPDYVELMNRTLKTPTTQQKTPEQQASVQDAMTRAALAVNYSPVAALGFNPHAITADVSGKSILGQQIAGTTYPATGQIAYQARSPKSVAHESIHRGLLDIRANPALPANLRARLEDDAEEESAVRQLMYQQVGNPETSDTAVEQRMAGTQWTPEEIGILDRLAQEAIKNRRPRGPR